MFLVCGEALVDMFVPAEGGGTGPLLVEAVPGGSPFNVAIGLARLGVATGLLTGLSTDAFGDLLARRLVAEGVSLDYVLRRPEPTTLSLVSLGTDGAARYAFHGPGADAAVYLADMPAPGPQVQGLHLGSYATVVPPIADALAALAALPRPWLVTLDANVRPGVEPRLDRWRARLDALLPHVAVAKASDEDLALLWPGRDAADVARDWLARGPRLVLVTQGAKGASAYAAGAEAVFAPAPNLGVVDTVGAGDAFQSALIAGLLALGARRPGDVADLPRGAISDLLDKCVLAGAIACTRRGADPPRAAR